VSAAARGGIFAKWFAAHDRWSASRMSEGAICNRDRSDALGHCGHEMAQRCPTKKSRQCWRLKWLQGGVKTEWPGATLCPRQWTWQERWAENIYGRLMSTIGWRIAQYVADTEFLRLNLVWPDLFQQSRSLGTDIRHGG
jgi:hypothetical protein